MDEKLQEEILALNEEDMLSDDDRSAKLRVILLKCGFRKEVVYAIDQIIGFAWK
jgi:hypothetical protein